MKKFFLFGFVLCILANGRAFAQVVADKIVAQIGSNIILQSDVTNDLLTIRYQAANQSQPLPPNFDCELLKGQIIEKALELQAQNVDSLSIDDAQVEDAFQRKVAYLMQQYGSREQLERAMGMTIDQYRPSIWSELKGQLLAQQEQQKITQDVTVSPAEVEAYYNSIPKDSLKYYESQFEASQIVQYPTPNQDVVDYIKNQLQGWKKDVEDGKYNFAELARIYSEDPSAKQNGGQISMNRIDDKGKFDPDFFNAAFRLREGQISPVIKSQFGYHIIQMVSRVGNDAIVRHILRIPPVTQEEINACTKKMDSVWDLVTNKKMDFSVAFTLYNQDKNGQFNAGAITGGYPQNPISPFTIDQLMDKDLATVIPTLKAGEYSKPMVFSDPYTGKQGVRLVYLKSRTEPHRENLLDDYISIQARALAQKKQKMIEDWLTTHVQDFYIKLDPSFSRCLEIEEWVKNSNDRVEHFSSTKIVR